MSTRHRAPRRSPLFTSQPLILILVWLVAFLLFSDYSWTPAKWVTAAALSVSVTAYVGHQAYRSAYGAPMLFTCFAAAVCALGLSAAFNQSRSVDVFGLSLTPWHSLLSSSPQIPLANMTQEYDYSDKISIVIAARDEDEFIQKTIKYTVDNTNWKILREIVIVDDASAVPVQTLVDALPVKYRNKVRVLRMPAKEGLIRARIAGADASTAPNILFLDGHCRPEAGWEYPLLKVVKNNYKALAAPRIFDIDRYTWQDKNTYGEKMMFDWNFEFDWYEDDSDAVPISPGGILMITRKWWEESGKYDSGMLEWGGENIEMSIRVWLCGGEVLVVPTSRIGHIFDRPAKPNPGNRLVRQVQTNQKRAAIVWLDDYYHYFDEIHREARPLDPGPGLEYRQMLRKNLECRNFQWFVDRFRSAFEHSFLLLDEYHHIQNLRDNLCLTAVGNELKLLTCDRDDAKQKWLQVFGNRLLQNLGSKACLTLTRENRFSVAKCAYVQSIRGISDSQFWIFGEGRIFRPKKKNLNSIDGNDKLNWSPEEASRSSSLCLTQKLRTPEACQETAEWKRLW